MRPEDFGYVQYKVPDGIDPSRGVPIRQDISYPADDDPLGRYGFVRYRVAYAAKPVTVWKDYRNCGHCGCPHVFWCLLPPDFLPAVPTIWICRACKHSNVEGADG